MARRASVAPGSWRRWLSSEATLGFIHVSSCVLPAPRFPRTGCDALGPQVPCRTLFLARDPSSAAMLARPSASLPQSPQAVPATGGLPAGAAEGSPPAYVSPRGARRGAPAVVPARRCRHTSHLRACTSRPMRPRHPPRPSAGSLRPLPRGEHRVLPFPASVPSLRDLCLATAAVPTAGIAL